MARRKAKQTEKSTQQKSTEKESEIPETVKFMMEKFGLDEEKARMAIDKGFRVEALMNGSAKNKLMEDSGIAGRIDRMKREVRTITESSREGSP